MTPHEAKRAAAAIELADALLEEFNNPSSALKGIGRVTMEKLLIYLKIVEQAQRRRSKRAKGTAEAMEADAGPAVGDPEAEPEGSGASPAGRTLDDDAE
jgi:hypothetical protein